MTKSKLWLVAVAGMAAAWAGCTKKNPHKCNAEEPCTLVEAPYCDITGAIGGTPYRCVPDPGDGGVGALRVDRGSHDFGAVPVGQTSAPATLTITNTGGVATGTLATTIGGAQATAFLASADTCAGQALAASATCTVTLTYTPASGSAAVGSLTIAGMPGGSVTVALSGSGVAPGAVAMVPPSADFGSIVMTMSSANTTFTVSNPGSAPTGMLATVLGGADAAQFAISSDGCAGQVLAGGASCTLTARFSPTTQGTKNATLSVTPAGSSTTTSTLTGMGLTVGEITMSPPMRDFGSLAQGDTTGAPFTFTVTNGGQTATGALAVSLTGGDANQFSITSNGCMGMAVAASATCTVAVRFNPTSAGPKAASLTITGTPGGSVTAALLGMGLSPPALSVSPGTQNYGDVITGNSSTQVFTLTNTGGVASGVPSASLGGADLGMFSVSSNTCTTTLAPSASCMIGVRFSPSSTGAKVGTLNVMATPGGSALAMLSGNGIPPSALTFTPPNLDLGNQLQGSNGTAMRLTVTNTGGAASGSVTVALGGTAAGEFAIAAQTCNGMTLAPAGTCTVDISFRPTSRGSKNASLNLTATPGGPAAASLMGVGQSPALLAVSPTTSSFGNVPTSSSSSAATFTVTNNGDVNSGVPAVTLGGTHMNQFATSNNTCTTALAPGGMCTVRATFSPTSLGAKNANLTITASPGGAPSAALDGTGVMPGLLAFSPTTYTFASTVVATQSVTHMFTLSNGGGATTGTISTSITGSQANQFTIVTDGCNGMTLPAAGSCNIVARFDPSSSGAKNASLSATASPGGTVNAMLSGTGLTQAVLSLSPPSQGFGSVPIGSSSAPITFTVTNNGDVVSGTPVVSNTGTDASAFTISNNNCTSGIAGGGSSTCTFQVTFNATGTMGSRSAGVTVTASPGGAPSATLSATAVAPGLLAMTPGSSDFSTALVGAQGMTRTFTVSNMGGAPTTAIGLSVTPSGQFVVESGMDACSGQILAPMGMSNSSCSVTLRFTPSTRGLTGATIAATATTGGTASASISGTGQTPATLVVSPLSFGFGSVVTNTTSEAAVFTITNTGDVPSGTPSVTVMGADFLLSANRCTTGIAPGTLCEVEVTLRPTSAVLRTGSLNVSASPGGMPPVVTLNGTGVTPGNLLISPTSRDFGQASQNSQGALQVFTVTNMGGSATTAITAAIDGSQSSHFTISSNGCNQVVLQANGNCQVSVRFIPQSPGSRTANLTASATTGGTAVASLNGVGTAAIVVMQFGTGAGVTTSSPSGISCPGTCSAEFPGGSVVLATITDAMSYLTNLVGCTSRIGNACTVLVDQPKNVGAYLAPSWTVSHNGPANGDDSARAIAVDSQGYVLVAGGEIVAQAGTGYSNFWLGKYSPDGAEQWTRSVPCTQSSVSCGATGVAVDQANAVLIVGTDVSGASEHPWVRKYSATGTVQWTRPQPEEARASAVDVDATGNVYVTGQIAVSGENLNIWLRKLDVDGNTLWTRTYNGSASSADYGTAVKVDQSGNVIVAGQQITTGGQAHADFFVRKYDAGGGIVWTAQYGSPGDLWDVPTALDLDSQSNVIVVGSVGGVIFTSEYMFARKLASGTGATMWTYLHPDNFTAAAAVAVDKSNNVTLVGRTDPGTVVTSLIAKLDASGTNPRVRSGVTNGSANWFWAAATDDFDNLVYAGHENVNRNIWVRKVGP